MKAKKSLLVLVLLGMMMAIHLRSAEAETTNCTDITSLPYTISTQGIYCLTQNLETNITSGAAITIETNNVVLDLNGFKIGGLSAGTATLALGILASQRKNITIRNGTVRGFFYGIQLYDGTPPYTTSQSHLIEDIRADMNMYLGIAVYGRGNIIRNNQVINTGGSSHTSSAHGIFAAGPGARVINNEVIETKGGFGGSVFCIDLSSSLGSVVENNRIGNSSLASGTNGIYISSSTDVVVSNNRVATMNYGVFFDGLSTGKYSNNLTSGCTTPFTPGGATDAGDNN